MSHTHIAVKAFHASETGRITAIGEPFTPSDESRAKELERNGLIEAAPEGKALAAAPQNKDAAKLRRNK